MFEAKYKALSLTQPMAWAIFNGKDIENRTWKNFSIIGQRIYIHASMKFDKKHWDWIAQNENRLGLQLPQELIHGALIGEVDIIDCVTNHGSMWWTGPYGFVLANAVAFDKPINCKGMLGFFKPELIVTKQVNC